VLHGPATRNGDRARLAFGWGRPPRRRLTFPSWHVETCGRPRGVGGRAQRRLLAQQFRPAVQYLGVQLLLAPPAPSLLSGERRIEHATLVRTMFVDSAAEFAEECTVAVSGLAQRIFGRSSRLGLSEQPLPYPGCGRTRGRHPAPAICRSAPCCGSTRRTARSVMYRAISCDGAAIIGHGSVAKVAAAHSFFAPTAAAPRLLPLPISWLHRPRTQRSSLDASSNKGRCVRFCEDAAVVG
jgi:hypothetical protein